MGYKLVDRYTEGMGMRIKGKVEGMTAGVLVGNHLRFSRHNRNYCLIKGEIFERLLGPNMNIPLTYLTVRLGQVWVSFGIYWK